MDCIDKTVTEEMNSLNYRLGLTKVKMILDRLNVSIQVANVTDYSDSKSVIKVAFSLY